MGRHLTTTLAVALAAAGAVAVPAIGQAPPKDTAAPELSVSFSSTQLESRLLNRDVNFGLAADESVKIDAALALGGRTFADGDVVAKGTSEIVGGPGKRRVELKLSDRGRKLIRRHGTELLVLRVKATDAAGNVTTAHDRLSRTQRLHQRRAD